MPVPNLFKNQLELPVISAPMFLVSGPQLVIEACKSGVIGTFPSLNARPVECLDTWLNEITSTLADYQKAHPEKKVAPFGVNQIIHPSNSRLTPDRALCKKYKVPFIITSQGDPTEIVKEVHEYGGIVFHDVIHIKHAKKAIAAGVDGIIAVVSGAGGHGGTANPFAFIREIREFWNGPLALAGAISDGYGIRAAQVLGADFAYMGTRFIATTEATADPAYKQMIVDSGIADVVYTNAFTGIHANYLLPSIKNAGIDLNNYAGKTQPDLDLGTKAWKDIWSAGHGTNTIHKIQPIGAVIDELIEEYNRACDIPPL